MGCFAGARVTKDVARANLDHVRVAAGLDEGAGAAAAAGQIAKFNGLDGLVQAIKERWGAGCTGTGFAVEEFRVEQGQRRSPGALGAIEEDGVGRGVVERQGSEFSLDRLVADKRGHGLRVERKEGKGKRGRARPGLREKGEGRREQSPDDAASFQEPLSLR